MAIKLEVEDYCQECMDFEADVTAPVKIQIPGQDDLMLSDTVVRCEYRNRCRAIKRYLERQEAMQHKMNTCEVPKCETE